MAQRGSVAYRSRGLRGRFRVDLRARDAAIVEARTRGDTLAEIGSRFGLSRERVRQIVSEVGTVDRRRSRAARAARERATAEQRQEEVLAAWRAGEAPKAIAAKVGLSRRHVGALLKAHLTPADRAARRRAQAAAAPGGTLLGHSDEALVAAVREAVDRVGDVPSGERYSEIALAAGLPSLSTIANRLGGWNAAVTAAGFVPASEGRGVYHRRWSEAACLEALRRVVADLGRFPSLREYQELSQGRPDLPSAATVRKRMGSWLMLAVRLDAGRGRRDQAGMT